MRNRTLIAAAGAGLLVVAAASALAQQSPSAATPQPGSGRGQMYGQQLFTPEERNEFWKKMEAAKTPEERTKLRNDFRAQADTRAKAQGTTLPDPRDPRGSGPGPGAPKS